MSPEAKKSTSFFYCTLGHLTSSFVPAMGHLLVIKRKKLIPRGQPRGERELELTDALRSSMNPVLHDLRIIELHQSRPTQRVVQAVNKLCREVEASRVATFLKANFT